MSVVDGSFDHTLEAEERAAGPLMGGFMNYGYQCGMLWGAALAAGAEVYRRIGPGPGAETAALLTTQELLSTFQARNKGEFNCLEITEMNFRSDNGAFPLKFFLKGGPIHCFRMSAGYAKDASKAIDAELTQGSIEPASCPGNCASMLVLKMGGSDMHAVMAAGFAGGIGLSGGACGALGASIWMIGMKCLEEGLGGDLWKSEVFQSRAAAAIESNLESADYEFECSGVVGRLFENAEDHADYVQQGGCSQVLNDLATHVYLS